MKVASLWVGDQLSTPHKIALSSFLYHGYEVSLYVYNDSLVVPDGVIKKDANKIIPEDKIFTHYGKYAAFSDLFRYSMIIKTGESWADIDTICLSDDLYKNEYVFSQESDNIFNGGILKLPMDSELAIWLYLESSKKAYSLASNSSENIPSWDSWTYIGPKLLTEGVRKFNKESFALTNREANGIDIHSEDPRELFWNPEYKEQLISIINKAKAITFFNSWLDQREFDKNQLPAGSGIEMLFNKYMSKVK